MARLTIEMTNDRAQNAYNQKRWAELLDDPELAKIEGRIETDRHGQIIMSPPPAPSHGSFQVEIAYLLRGLLRHGRTLSECPVSTADGVKAADVAWASPECMRDLGNRVCFPRAPEICVEVLSPRNRKEEINEKIALYFQAGANEVWICDLSGQMSFFSAPKRSLKQSKLCPEFPRRVKLS